MKLKGIYIVPMIGLGWFDETLNLANMKVKFRNIMILCVKIELYKQAQ